MFKETKLGGKGTHPMLLVKISSLLDRRDAYNRSNFERSPISLGRDIGWEVWLMLSPWVVLQVSARLPTGTQ